MELRIVKFANGMDVIADLEAQVQEPDDTSDVVAIAGLYLTPVITLHKPRVLIMQQTQNGIQVGLAPFNIEDDKDAISIEVFRDKVLSVFPLPKGSRLVTSYLESTTKIDLSSKMSPAAPSGGSRFVAN